MPVSGVFKTGVGVIGYQGGGPVCLCQGWSQGTRVRVIGSWGRSIVSVLGVVKDRGWSHRVPVGVLEH